MHSYQNRFFYPVSIIFVEYSSSIQLKVDAFIAGFNIDIASCLLCVGSLMTYYI